MFHSFFFFFYFSSFLMFVLLKILTVFPHEILCCCSWAWPLWIMRQLNLLIKGAVTPKSSVLRFQMAASEHSLSYCFKQQNTTIVWTGVLQKNDGISIKRSGWKGSQLKCLVFFFLTVPRHNSETWFFFFLCKLTFHSPSKKVLIIFDRIRVLIISALLLSFCTEL